MTNQEIIQRFESDAVAEVSFHHADHVRLAFAYLREYPVLQALEKFATALKRFAAARGKAQLYHETITHAYFFLIRARMARSQDADWDEFARQKSGSSRMEGRNSESLLSGSYLEIGPG